MLLGNSLLKHGVSTPASIAATSGTPQSANCGAAYAASLVATVKNAGGVGLAGISVTFTAPVTGASGTFASTGTRTETVVTNGSGVATSSAFTANGTGGASAYNVTATAGALSCNFSLTNNWTWFYYLTSLALPAWWRMRDTSGVTVVNSGSLGSAVDLTATAWTMAQAGQLGAGEAGLADGANTRLQCANNVTLAGYTTWEWGFLVNPSSAGEAGFGGFFFWGDAVHEPTFLFFSAVTALKAQVVDTAPTDYATTTSTGLTQSAWNLVFMAYDNVGDRKIHIYVGKGGVVTEATYTAQPAMVGTYKVPASTLNIFNAAGQTRTFAGLGDEAFCIGGRTFTPAERLQMTLLAGV